MSVVSQSLPPSYQEAQMMTQACVTITKNESLPQTTESSILAGSQTITTAEIQDDPALDSEKKLIYKHPLFPLLALLFEKCEQATQTSDCPSSESFDVDIQSFLQHQEKTRKSFLLEDRDLDNLMVRALEVLRIHLLELEKVNDLCKDFCTRYIGCLKGKLQSENLLKVEYDGPPSPGSPTGQSGAMSQVLPGVVNPVPGSNVLVQQGVGQNSVSMASWNQGQIVSGGTVYQMVQTAQGLVAQPIQIQTTPLQPQVATPNVIQGNAPLSQIVSSTPQTTTSNTNPVSSTPHPQLDSDDEDGSDKKRNKRGVLPKYATQIMKSWLFQHIVHPYPTEDEKRQIAQQTNLTLLQVNNWFINARRRILQPMLDSSNPETPKVKKSKPQTRPSTRFWPESIANIQPQIPSTAQSQAVIDNATTVTDSQPASVPVSHPVSHTVTQPLIVPTFMTPDGQVLTIANPLSVINQQQITTEQPLENHHYESQLQSQMNIKHEEAVDDGEHHKDILNTSVSEDNISADNDSDSSL